MDSALFSMSLWDSEATIGDDVERDGVYSASVSCKNLNNLVLDLKPLAGLTKFAPEEYDHVDSVELLKDSYEITPIAELEDDLSRGRNDYRLVEATVSFSGVQNSKTGNQFGKMLLKDESTMTLDAIESGENLLLNCITSTDIATRFGKYSKILALCTTKVRGQWGLSASVAVALGVIVVSPPEVEDTSSATTKEDDLASYFKVSNDWFGRWWWRRCRRKPVEKTRKRALRKKWPIPLLMKKMARKPLLKHQNRKNPNGLMAKTKMTNGRLGISAVALENQTHHWHSSPLIRVGR